MIRRCNIKNHRPGKNAVWNAIAGNGLCDRDTGFAGVGEKLDLQMVNLEEYEVNVDTVAKVPKQLAEKYHVIAVSEIDNRLQLVMSDPLNFYAQEDIRQIVDMPLEVLLCEEMKIRKAIEYYYAEISTKQAAKKPIFPQKRLKFRS